MAAVAAIMREEAATDEAPAVVMPEMARPSGSRAWEEVRMKTRDFLRDREVVAASLFLLSVVW